MFDYQKHLDAIDRKAYHEGELQWEEDGYTVTRTNQWSPPGCHDACGVLFYTKDDKLVKVEGDPLSPWANGKLCMRCLNLDEAVNDPTRVKYPMRRAGKRGENKWERISWDEALAEIKEKVTAIKEEYGTQAIVCVHGTGRNVNWQNPIIGHAALQTPNVCMLFFSGNACYTPRTVGAIAPIGDYILVDASQGFEDRYANPDWRPPEVLVVWGNEPIASNADGYMGHWLVNCVQMGTKIISIDPRLTWWGARAEYFLQLRPGTDCALVMAFLHVIIEEDLYDHEFVDCWCAYFDELAETVKDATPEWAAEICWLDPEDIRGAARLYASGNNSAIQWGLAMDQQLSAMQLNLAVSDLIAICGNLDRPGGNTLAHDAFDCSADYDTCSQYLPPEIAAKRLNREYGLGMNGHDPIAGANADAVLHAIETGQTANGEPYPIKMVWIQSSNALSCPSWDAPRAYEALNKVDFIVNADPILTPTAVAHADLILPIAMGPERNSVRSWWYPLKSMKKVVDYYEAVSDEELAILMGKTLNPDLFERLGWNSDIDLLNWFLAGADGSRVCARKDADGAEMLEERGCGYTFDGLCEKGGYLYDEWNATYEKYAKGMVRQDGSIGFATISGRVELMPPAYRAWGLHCDVYHTEPTTGPLSTPELMKDYPLILTTGGRSFEFFHSEHRQHPTMREFHPWPKVMINPFDAQKYGIQDGQWIWIENMHGRFRQIAQLTSRVREGVIHAEHAWWFPETEGAEPHLFGTFDSNPNNCIPNFETGDYGIGACAKSGICRVYPYQEGDVMPGEVVTRQGGFGDFEPGVMKGYKTELR